jgi:hypothetical protein
MLTASTILIFLILALTTGADFVKNKWLKCGFGAALVVVCVSAIAGVFG